MAWGSAAKTCTSLLKKVENGSIESLTILSMKIFTDEDAKRLAAALPTSPLLSIHASGHRLRPETLRILGTAVSKSKLKELAIGDSSMGDEGALALVEGLQDAERLETLDLSLKGVGLETLMAIIKSIPNILHLNLSRNPNIGHDLRNCEALQPNVVASFFELNLSDCSLDSDTAFKWLGPHLKNVRTVRFSKNDLSTLESFPFSSLAEAQHIHMDGCGLNDCQLGAIHTCKNLVSLDISRNSLSCTELLVDSLAKLNCLREFRIAGNRPTSEGLRSLLTHGLPSHGLAVLDLGETNCSAENAVQALRISNKAKLHLCGNKLGEGGFSMLQRHADLIHAVTYMDLAANGATSGAVQNFVQNLATAGFSSSLETLVVGGNGGPHDEVESAISSLCHSYPSIDVARDRKDRK